MNIVIKFQTWNYVPRKLEYLIMQGMFQDHISYSVFSLLWGLLWPDLRTFLEHFIERRKYLEDMLGMTSPSLSSVDQSPMLVTQLQNRRATGSNLNKKCAKN